MSKTARVTLSGLTSISKRPSPTCCSALLTSSLAARGAALRTDSGQPATCEATSRRTDAGLTAPAARADPVRGLTEVGDLVAPAQQIRAGGDRQRVDEHEHLDGREAEDLLGQASEALLRRRAGVHHDDPVATEAELAVDGGAVQGGKGRARARDGRQVATAQDDAHGQGPSSLSAPAASSSVTRRSRRETCICEMPTRAAIWSWLSSSK